MIGQQPVSLARDQLPRAQLDRRRAWRALLHKVVQPLAVGRKMRLEREAFRRDLVFAVVVVDPDCAPLAANGGDEKGAVCGDADTEFLSRSERQLFWLAFRKALSPQVRRSADFSAEVHPPSVL